MKSRFLTTLIPILFGIIYCPAFISTASGQSDSWSDNTRGTAFKWETAAEWSLGVTPSVAQLGILITNGFAGSGLIARTVSIDPTTVLSNAINGCMTINNLTMSSPTSSLGNELFVSNTGVTPLTIEDSLTISSRGIVSITNSVLTVHGNTFFTNLVDDGNLVLDTGSLVTSNGVTAVIGFAGTGAFTISDGTWIGYAASLGTAFGASGTLAIGGGTNTLLFRLSVGTVAHGTGTVWLTGGSLTVSGGDINGVVNIGDHGVGQMTVSNGSWLVLGPENMNIASEAFSQGTLTIAGGTNTLRTSVEIGGPSAAGTVWLTGGLLITSNNTDIGESGLGQMTMSNGNWQAASEIIGDLSGSQGTLNMAGGTNKLRSSFSVGSNAGATGTVWMTDGLLTVSNGFVDIGSQGIGRMTVSNGTWTSRNVAIAFGGSSQGTLTIAGGTTICTNMILGTANCAAVGILNVAGGALYVTNNGNAVLEIRSGTLTLSSGILEVDKFVMTNSCAHFVRTGGTLIYGTAVLSPNRDDDGDGIPNGYEQSHGLDPLNPADASEDNDGDGFSNLQEYLAGTDPNNSDSAFGITSISQTGNNVLVTWMMGSGKTNALQWTAGAGDGSYQTNSFANLFIVTNTVGTITNYLDVGGATNKPARYYRVRLVP
jgi:hypothetical protein